MNNNQAKRQDRDIIEISGFEGDIPCELSADYILPDTYPDVKKLLRVKARPVLISRFVSGRRLEFSGAVDYTVIFSSESGESEAVQAVHFTGDWNGTLGELEGLDRSDITITPHMGSCTAKLANPRKLTIKSTVVCDVRTSVTESCSLKCEGASPKEVQEIEYQNEILPSRVTRTFVADPLRISENIELDPGMPAVDDVISCSAAFCFTEARVQSDSGLKVSIKGFLMAEFILKPISEASDCRCFKKKLPVSYLVGADDFADEMKKCREGSLMASASAATVEVLTSVSDDSYGERRIIELDVSADVTVQLFGIRDSRLTLDAYIPCRDCEYEHTELEAFAPVQSISQNFSVGESLSLDELKIPEGASLVDTEILMDSSKLDISRGKGTVTANALISCILSDANGFFGAEAVLPVKYELSTQELTAPLSFDCSMTASDLRTRLDSERLYLDFEVSFTARISERVRRNALMTIRPVGEAHKPDTDANISLCYRLPGESLWSIAKRYGTTVRAIEAANKDTSRVIMIPKDMPKSFVI